MRALARSRWFDRARRGGHFSDDALEAMSTAPGPPVEQTGGPRS
jgi:hypothetical protein